MYFLSDGGPSDGLDQEPKMYFLWPSDRRTWSRTEKVLFIWRRTVRLLDLMKNRKYTFHLTENRQTAGPDEEWKVYFWLNVGPTWQKTEYMSFWHAEGLKVSFWHDKGPKETFCMNWRKTIKLTWWKYVRFHLSILKFFYRSLFL